MSLAVAQQPKRRDPPDAAEAEFVAKKRRMGASWDAIAAMLARPTLDVRRAFDPAFPHAGFPSVPVARAAPRTTSVMVLGKRVPVDGATPEELAVLKALAPGEFVAFSGLRSRVSGVGGELVGAETVRRLVRRVDQLLPAPLRVTGGKDGFVIVARPGAPRTDPVARPQPEPDPFGLGLPPVAVDVLKRLVEGGGEPVPFEVLQQASVERLGRPFSFDILRARVSQINKALPAGVRVVSEYCVGYRLTGGERLQMSEGGNV